MVCHVGCNLVNGKVGVFNSSKAGKATLHEPNESGISTFQIPISIIENFDQNFKVEPIFAYIREKLQGEILGCLCFYINFRKNSIKKQLIECGLKSGFEKVQVIDKWTALYNSLALHSNVRPKNGDVIWIVNYYHFEGDCVIWKKENGFAKLVTDFKFRISNFNEIFSKVNWKPNLLFFESGTSKLEKINVQMLFPACIIKTLSAENLELGAMLKARNLTNDPKFSEWKSQNIFDIGLFVKLGEENIMTIEKMQSLPISKTAELKNGRDPIYVIDSLWYQEEKFQNIGTKFCKIDIDENGIYSIIFQNMDDTLNSNHPSVDQEIRRFKFPSKILTNNDKIEAVALVGIDLGTSRCCAAVNRRNGIETVALENAGGRLLPSYVAYDEPQDKCGQIVIDRLKYNSASTVFDFKRIIGKNLNEIEIDSIWPFSITNFNSQVLIQIIKCNDSTNIKPEEASASLLKHIKFKCEQFQGKPLSKAVITIPAVFTESQKDATRKAAKIAGWETLHLLPEPIAASFAYFIDRPIPNQSIILRFDLGGGTLDVCISKIENDEIQILSQNGDSQLGGRDFDKILINHFRNLLISNYGISLTKNKYKLMIECQKLKEVLSIVDNANFDVEEFDSTKEGFFEVNRMEFEKMTLSLLNRIRSTINAALFSAKLEPSQINTVLQVGGGSRMPMVKNLLKQIFPNSAHCCETNPDEVVAVGAAYYAYNLFS